MKKLFMRDPAEILTPSGYEEYKARLWTLDECLRYFYNNADDLWLGAGEDGDKVMDAICLLSRAISEGRFTEGPWFEDED